MTDELKVRDAENRSDAVERTEDRESPVLTSPIGEPGVLETQVAAPYVETLPVETTPRTAPPATAVSVSRQSGAAVAPAREESTGPLFTPEEAQKLRVRWDSVQVAFVDEPRDAVKQADSLVAETMKRLAEVFASERANLEVQTDRGGEVSTEDLRIAFRRYRSFFSRLLSV